MKRIFWLGIGVVTGVALSRKATQTARQASPAGLASNLGDAVSELAGALGTFGADVRAGMSEREQELRDMVEDRSGVSAPRPSAGRHAAPRPARARRAEG
ncbi:hypothetical protein GCM10027445_36540 [Amycolatopsis endophytica]|uniref:Chromosome condensin MukBEF MukE localization factor n=1 Tax=Amycolatopsis endophytica TaxID=860233 RepID=A0A853B7T9_9PSEU|nr:hypothetical protein [Amycolatopsis endophytica]NYI91070.1 chromosome condensin MukBEF MukE localization factor [Amycolatopsis endophytica]